MKRLGFVLPYSRESHYLNMIRGMHACVSNCSGWAIETQIKYIFDLESEKHFNPEQVHHKTVSKRVLEFQEYDAVIAYAHFPHDLLRLSHAHCPVVLICPDIFDDRFISIRPDPELSAKLVVQHLHECGYESLSMMDQSYTASDYRVQLYQLIRRQWLALDLPFQTLELASYQQLLHGWTSPPKSRDAYIFTAYDRMETAIQHAQRINLQIPSEIGFLALDAMNQLFDRSITVTHIDYNTFKLGYDAARRVIEWAETGQRPSPPQLYQTQVLHPGITTLHRPAMDQSVQQVIAYIENHYRDEIIMEDLMVNLTISQKTLERRFKEQTGATPKSYLINYRLEKVQELLRNSSHPMTVVAAHCGFQDPRYMSRAFKKRFQVTPREYRSSTEVLQ